MKTHSIRKQMEPVAAMYDKSKAARQGSQFGVVAINLAAGEYGEHRGF
jgi:hypothetical protein